MGVAPRTLNQGRAIDSQWIARNLPENKFIVGYAGTIGNTNALHTILETAERLTENKDIHFVLVGDGALLPEYRESHGWRPNISFPGSVPKEYVSSVLNEFDLLVLATHSSAIWNYGQSLNKLIDYMLSGKPVVAAMGGYPSMINEAGSGSFVASEDSEALAEELLRYAGMTDEQRSAIGERGRSWLLERQTYPKLAERLANALFADPEARSA